MSKDMMTREEFGEKYVDMVSSKVDAKFKENPAYARILAKIASDFLLSDEKNISVSEEQGALAFDINNGDEKVSMKIDGFNEGGFNVRSRKESGSDRNKRKYVFSSNVSITKNGFIYYNEESTVYNKILVQAGDREKVSSVSRRVVEEYNPNGIMYAYESKRDKEFIKNGSIDDCNYILSMGTPIDSTILRRECFDVIKVIKDDNIRGKHYRGQATLNLDKSIKDLSLPTRWYYPEHVIITPLSEKEIEETIARESNPKIAQGLREWSKGRKDYTYDSDYNPEFVCENGSELENSRTL